MARKKNDTTLKVVSVFDGEQTAQDVFIGLIADQYRIAKSQLSV